MISKNSVYLLLTLLVVTGGSLILGAYHLEYGRPLPVGTQPKFVGRDSCIACHTEQNESFIGSHHDLAMDVANDQTVLGDFDNATLEHYGVTSRMFRRDGGYWINTEGPDGQLHDFQIQWVFGVDPLQQYMVDLSDWDFGKRTKLVSAKSAPLKQSGAVGKMKGVPENDNPETNNIAASLGRVHVLRVSWDTHAKRWFYLDPPDLNEKIAPDDPLHWTGVAQRWNTMCADCHSTNVHKGFDVSSLTYETDFSEIDVSCEACHGPGSVHVELAHRWLGKTDPTFGDGLVTHLNQSAQTQIDACAPCHARRVQIHEQFHAGRPLLDHYTNVLLDEGIYFDDGQVLDEDYVHGSFLQSKMFHKGIRCTDCHDPHSAKLIRTGNAVCTSCHQHPAAVYDHPAHHHHKSGSTGALCVNCHMPATTYMAIDSRRDHSFRIPRPDLSLKFGTPNACTGCHLDRAGLPDEKTADLKQYLDWMKTAEAGSESISSGEMRVALAKVDQWCDEACQEWYGESRKQPFHFAELLAESRGHVNSYNGGTTERRAEVGNGDAGGGANDEVDVGRMDVVQNGNREGVVARLANFISKPSSPESPAIARATAIHELIRLAPENASQIFEKVSSDESALVRRAALSTVETINNPRRRANLLVASLSDESRSVRVEAARIAALSNRQDYSQAQNEAFEKAYAEFNNTLAINDDRAGAHLTLGSFIETTRRTRNGLLAADLRAAAKHYNDAIRVEPDAIGARKNLAAVFDQLAETAVGEKKEQYTQRARELRIEELEILRRFARLIPTDDEIRYQLGLMEYLVGEKDAALVQIKAASELEPDRPQYRLSLALILDQNNRRSEAVEVLKATLRRWPDFSPAKQLLESW